MILSLLNEINVRLTGNINTEIISKEVNFTGELSAKGLLENKTDCTKVDVIPRALVCLPEYTQKGKRVRYESLVKKKKVHLY